MKTQSSRHLSSPRLARFVVESQVRFRFQKNQKHVGVWLRNQLLTLGPAAIKIGQFLSTRPDILSPQVINELSLLQDKTPIENFSDIRDVVETSLQKPISSIFSSFDETPIASASIGQVHLASLKNKTVVVKVQKPNVAAEIKRDIQTIMSLLDFLSGFPIPIPPVLEARRLMQQFDIFISSELDYSNETLNMRRFHKLMESQPVIVPRVYASLSSDRVIVMEYIKSIKITDTTTLLAKKIDLKLVAERLSNSFLYQTMITGLVHCDPHPGNVGVRLVDSDPYIVFYDFGNTVKLSAAFRASIADLVFALYQKDVPGFVDILVKLDIIQINSVDDIFDAQQFFSFFINYLENMDFSALRTSIASGELANTLGSNINLNQDIFCLFRVFSLLDGTCTLLDDSFNYFTTIQPYAEDMMNNISFIDSRSRNDLQKMSSMNSKISETNMNVSRSVNKITSLDSRLNFVQVMAGAYILLHDRVDAIFLFSGFVFASYFVRRK
jgi:ubiquinone biosynthesis protein